MNVCPFCKGKVESGKTTFTVDLEFGIVVVRAVPALVCSLCGAEWIADNVAEKLENLVASAKHHHCLVEVSNWQ